MCRWRTPLHVLLSAAAAFALALSFSPIVPARADTAPKPYVVCIDPGHGGTPVNGHPEITYDSGAIGLHGLVEKDLTLDVSRRLRAQLEADMVTVVMTRDGDAPISIEQRSQICNAAHADLFMSIHFNAFTDPKVGGSLVLYPGPKDLEFARVADKRMAAALGRSGIGDGGPQLRDDWWISVQAPVVTVEPAYITNPHEAGLLATPAFRDSLATSLRDGIETYKPDILRRKAQLLTDGQPPRLEPATGTGDSATPVPPPAPGLSFLDWLILVAAAAALIRWRRQLLPVLAVMLRVGVAGVTWVLVRRNRKLRRRRALRERHLVGRKVETLRPTSVYDELFL
jgi:N-acetylmuramoyl-L-alanine amidase